MKRERGTKKEGEGDGEGGKGRREEGKREGGVEHQLPDRPITALFILYPNHTYRVELRHGISRLPRFLTDARYTSKVGH